MLSVGSTYNTYYGQEIRYNDSTKRGRKDEPQRRPQSEQGSSWRIDETVDIPPGSYRPRPQCKDLVVCIPTPVPDTE